MLTPDPIHLIYIRMSELAEKLLEHPRFRELAAEPIAGELLGQIHAIAREAGKLKLLSTRLDPALAPIWDEVLNAAFPTLGPETNKPITRPTSS